MKKSRGRLVSRTPVEVAQNLVEELASEVEFEQALELENEVDDRLAVMWGRTTLIDRLWSAKGQVVQLHVAHSPAHFLGSTPGQVGECGHVSPAVIHGRLVDLGPDWLAMESLVAGNLAPYMSMPHLVVPLERVLGVTGAPEVAGRPENQSKIWVRRKLTQLLRPLVQQSQRVKVHSELGCFTARVKRVASDHLDLELLGNPICDGSGNSRNVSVKFAAVSFIEADLG